MDWVAFENDRKFVLEGLRHGEVDYVEHVSEAAERTCSAIWSHGMF